MDAYQFCYAWRWTQPTHNVLPAEVMAQIKPLEHAPAPLGWTREAYHLDPARFDGIVVASADLTAEDGTHWLLALPVFSDETVVVRWDCDTVAVETSWEIFTRFWDDFCYPTSDDVQVFPRSSEWLLLYHEIERFEWGRRIVSA